MSHEADGQYKDVEMSPALTNPECHHVAYGNLLNNGEELKNSKFVKFPLVVSPNAIEHYLQNVKTNGHSVYEPTTVIGDDIITNNNKPPPFTMTPRPAHNDMFLQHGIPTTEELSRLEKIQMDDVTQNLGLRHAHICPDAKNSDPLDSCSESPGSSVITSITELMDEGLLSPAPLPTSSELGLQHQSIRARTLNLIQRLRWMQRTIVNSQIRAGLSDLVEVQHQRATLLRNLKTSDGNSDSVVIKTEPIYSHGYPFSEGPSSSQLQLNRSFEVSTLASQVSFQIRADIDSDATLSSSGAESEDEVETQSSYIRRKKHPCLKWVRERSEVAYRWTWLQAQVSDLEYRIRQHGDIHKRLRTKKPAVVSHASLSSDSRAVAEGECDQTMRSSRCMPYSRPNPKQSWHRFVNISKAPILSQKARRRIILRCQCERTGRICAVCAGHHSYALPAEVDMISQKERVGQIDGTFHPVLSTVSEINAGIVMEQSMNDSQQHTHLSIKNIRKMKKLQKSQKKNEKLLIKQEAVVGSQPLMLNKSADSLAKAKELKKKALFHKAHKKKVKRLRREVLSDTEEDEWYSDDNEEFRNRKASWAAKPSKPYADVEPLKALVESGSARKFVRKEPHARYEIDDIVIPYHIAATNRVEKLVYKEIDTPRWREVPTDPQSVHETVSRCTSIPMTPITPSIPPPSVLSSVTTLGLTTPAQDQDTPPNSAASLSDTPSCNSLSSLASAQNDENLADDVYIERHSKLEQKERSRYMNFITAGTHRTRTRSVCNRTIPANGEDGSLTETQAGTLSRSHNETTFREELDSSQSGIIIRCLRSASFTGAPKVTAAPEQSSEPALPIWPNRRFPLAPIDEETLDPEYVPPNPEPIIPVTAHNDTEWKVIKPAPIDEVRHEAARAPLVLKLTKSHS